AQLLRIQGNGEGAGTRYVDFTVCAHDIHEFAEFFGVAGDFDGEAFDAGIDYAPTEDLRFLEDGGAAFLRGANAQQDQFPDDGGTFREIVGLQHVDQLVHLLDDLRALQRIDVDHDG